MQRNRLAAESSPYLQQHAGNPVDWWPWGPAAFEVARRDDKPVLLSVGYSACHWCHVMAHESFEDPATAALMNTLFVNVKVDREERPDVDKIYQLAQALLTHQTGGWPLTMFLTPEQEPFFGGTYFPREARHGMPPFGELLQRVAEYYRTHRDEITRQGPQLREAFLRLMPPSGSGGRLLDDGPLRAVRAELERSFDRDHGGFGRAPKFPQVPSLERCLRHWHASAHGGDADLKALFMASLSLTRMAEGGIRDQLAGGFCRYSVDRQWMIPHFEKMLYDNGPLLGLYAAAHLATGEPLFAAVAGDTAGWVLREMRAPQGAFYSSLDADSDGAEGRFYVWSREEVQATLDPAEYPLFARRYGLDLAPNFEGRWHLHVQQPIETIAAESGRSAAQVETILHGARTKLLARRALRTRPGRDEKILTAWNALMIKGLAVAARALVRPDLAAAATEAVDFIRAQLWRDGRLLASTRDGHAVLPAYLDDHAFLADALLELLQIRWRGRDFEFLVQLVEAMLDRFQDAEQGGFFFTASDHERLIHRSKTFADESLPAGNAIAASVLCRLGLLLAELRYVDAAERTLLAGLASLQDAPLGHVSLAHALEEFLVSPQIVILRGAAPGLEEWRREIARLYAPQRLVFAIPDDAPDLPAALAGKRAGPETVGYVCTGMTCGPPIADLGALVRRLRPESSLRGAPAVQD
jgi:uncharacterized protein YyaL (SSP411 family)